MVIYVKINDSLKKNTTKILIKICVLYANKKN